MVKKTKKLYTLQQLAEECDMKENDLADLLVEYKLLFKRGYSDYLITPESAIMGAKYSSPLVIKNSYCYEVLLPYEVLTSLREDGFQL